MDDHDEVNDDDHDRDEMLCDKPVNHSDKSKLKMRSKARVIRSAWFNKDIDPEKNYRELVMLFTPWRNEDALM